MVKSKESKASLIPLIMILVLIILIGGMGWKIYDDHYRFANKAKKDLQKLDPQFYKMRRGGHYDTNRSTGLVVWDRTDGSTCKTRYVYDELIYPPISDCYFNAGPRGGRYKNGRWIDG